MKRRALPFVTLLAAIAVAATACGPAATPEPSPTAEPAAAFPLTVTDDLGRQVTISAPPQRVVSLAPSNTETLFAIGAGDLVVGVTEYCDYPPEVEGLDQVGGFSASTISVEKIVALEPDVVFSVGDIQQPVIEALEQVNVPVVALDPNEFEAVYGTIELMGRVTAREDGATRVIDDMTARAAAVQEAVAGIPQDQRLGVYWETYDEPLMSVGSNSFTHQLIEMAGGVNIFGDVEEAYPQVNAEEVVERNPAAIMGAETMGDKLTTDQVAQRPGWGQIDAVQNGRIYLFDGNLVSRTGPRLVDALEQMAEALYPELFE